MKGLGAFFVLVIVIEDTNDHGHTAEISGYFTCSITITITSTSTSTKSYAGTAGPYEFSPAKPVD